MFNLALILYGKENTGKTSTMRLVFDKLSKIGCSLCDQHMQKDFVGIVRINKTGKNIAIISAGDSRKAIEKAIEILKFKMQENQISYIDCLLCTSRSKGESVEYCNAIANEKIRIKALRIYDSDFLVNQVIGKKSYELVDKYYDFNLARIFALLKYKAII